MMMKQRITGVVLAGGASKRMGRSKALLPIGDKRMIEWIVHALSCLFDEVIVVTRHPQALSMLEDVRFIQDTYADSERNSLVGLYSGLLHASNDRIFVVPCDMPLLNRGIIEHMIGLLDSEDVLVPMIGPHYQPLHAFYRKSCLPFIRRYIDLKQYKIIRFYDDVLVRTIGEEVMKLYDPELNVFLNVNSEESYGKVTSVWNRMEKQWHSEWNPTVNTIKGR
jgi:molybdenum cofactor guanylyltransferase